MPPPAPPLYEQQYAYAHWQHQADVNLDQQPADRRAIRRPGSATAVAVVSIILGALLGFAGVAVLAVTARNQSLLGAPLASMLVGIGIYALILCVLFIVGAIKLLNGKGSSTIAITAGVCAALVLVSPLSLLVTDAQYEPADWLKWLAQLSLYISLCVAAQHRSIKAWLYEVNRRGL